MTPCPTRCTLRDSDELCRAALDHMGGAVGRPRLRRWGRRTYPDRTAHGKGGIVMTDRSEIPHHEPVPGPGEPPVPSLEEDESAAAGREEESAYQLRSEPDPDARTDGDG